MGGKWLFAFLVVGLLLNGCSPDAQKNEQDDSTEVNSDVPAAEMDQPASKIDVLANDEKIIEMLIKTGVISEDASHEEIEKALQKYLKDKNKDQLTNEKEKKKYIDEIKKKIQEGS
jgi:bacillopeptidase F (M6 metalloprotease family)